VPMKDRPQDIVSGRLADVGRKQPSSRAAKTKANYSAERLGITAAEDEAAPPSPAPAPTAPLAQQKSAMIDDAEAIPIQFTSPSAYVQPRDAAPIPRVLPRRLAPAPSLPSEAETMSEPQPLARSIRPGLNGLTLPRGKVLVAVVLGAIAAALVIWSLFRSSGSPQQAQAFSPVTPPAAEARTAVQAQAKEDKKLDESAGAAMAKEDLFGKRLREAVARPAPGTETQAPSRPLETQPVIEPAAERMPGPSSPAGPPALAKAPAELQYRSCPSDIVLSGVVSQPNGPLANINGRFVGVGDRVNGAKVVKIDSFAVEMELDGKRFTATFGPPAPPTEDSSGEERSQDKAASGNSPAQSQPAEPPK